ncbi:polysaccharide lyase [Negadavirga shengliensis]|uniref:Polysaccharide lyase n=1 Tax=Negadavirga shengliensis TaxID=1389218 RepID=A0ABV9T2J1_9BACT
MKKHQKITNLFMCSILISGFFACDLTQQEEPIAEESPLLLATATSSSFIFYDDFESGEPLEDAHGHELGADHSLTSVSKPGYSGEKAARFELRDNDPIVKGSRRAEVTIVKGEDGHIEKDTWYSFDLYVPKDYVDEDDDEVINQWHQSGNASASIRIKNGRFLWRYYINGQREDFDLGSIKKESWNSFVIHMIHSYGSDGLTEVWLNDEKLLDRKGRNINDDDLPKWKIGIYKSKWADEKTTTSRRVLYYDNVKVGDSRTDYELMAYNETNEGSEEQDDDTTSDSGNNDSGSSGGDSDSGSDDSSGDNGDSSGDSSSDEDEDNNDDSSEVDNDDSGSDDDQRRRPRRNRWKRNHRW